MKMDYSRWILIAVTFVIVFFFTFQVYIWGEEFKGNFLYRNDYLGYIMIFVFIIALTGIFKWFLKEEIVLTDSKRKRRKR